MRGPSTRVACLISARAMCAGSSAATAVGSISATRMPGSSYWRSRSENPLAPHLVRDFIRQVHALILLMLLLGSFSMQFPVSYSLPQLRPSSRSFLMS